MKTVYFFLSVILVYLSSSFDVYSSDFVSGNYSFNIIDSNKKEVSLCGCSGNRLVIPSSVKYGGLSYTVTTIEAGALSGSHDYVLIPNSVVSIFKQNGTYTKLVFEDGDKTLLTNVCKCEESAHRDCYEGTFSYARIDSLYLGRNITWENPGYSCGNCTDGFPFTYAHYGDNNFKLKYLEIGPNVTSIRVKKDNFLFNTKANIVCRSKQYIAPCKISKNINCIVPKTVVNKYRNIANRLSPIYPIADVMFFEEQTNQSYRNRMQTEDKSKIRTVAFYNGFSDLDEDLLKEGMNPNCTYYINSQVYLSWDNVISFDTQFSEKLSICDNCSFETLLDIEAMDIEYLHIPSSWADGNKGWETIALPFECTNVEASEKGAIAPVMLGSSGNFWLRQYVGSSDDAVYFASTSDGVMKANTPYLIAFPGDKMGKGSLEGQTITFKAKNVTIPVTTIPSIQKNGYTFVGNYDKTADEGGGWTLNAEGSAFVWSETVGDKPFSAYFKGEAPAAGASALRMSFGQMDNATGLEQNMADLIGHADEAVYTLDGRKVNTKDLKPGLYIKNHKKMMVR